MRVPRSLAIVVLASAAGAQPQVARVAPRFAPLDVGLVYADLASSDAPPAGSTLIITEGLRPIGTATVETGGPPGTFRLPPSAVARLRARQQVDGWLAPSAAAAPPTDWPPELPLSASIESLTPAQFGAWISAGTRQGVAAGDVWWRRVPRQPAARFDVLFAAEDLAFARVVPLAQSVTLAAGQSISRWPTAADSIRPAARSSVAHVARDGGDAAIWVASLPGVDAPPEPHVDFIRGSKWVGHGLVQRADDRFWYVGLISESAGIPQVGDTAVIRTRADVDARRIVARVFEHTEKGAVIDAGERDGFGVGQSALAYRGAEFIGRIEVLHVQHTYSIIAPTSRPGEAPPVLTIGDEIHQTPPPPPRLPVGTLTGVTDETLVTVSLTADAPLDTPLLVEQDAEPQALVVLLAADNRSAVGYIVPRSNLAPLAPDMIVSKPSAAGTATPAAASPRPTQQQPHSSPARESVPPRSRPR